MAVKTLRDIDWDARGNLRVAIGYQREVASLMRDCDAMTGRFRFADEGTRIAVLDAAGRLWDELDRLIDDVGGQRDQEGDGLRKG